MRSFVMSAKSPAAAPVPRIAFDKDEVIQTGLVGSHADFYRKVNTGQLVAHKAGKRTIVFAEDLEAYRRSLPAFRRREEE
jgi:hypothetical protein